VLVEDAIYDRDRDELRDIGVTLMTSQEVAASQPRTPTAA
jgi:hypothetical protein